MTVALPSAKFNLPLAVFASTWKLEQTSWESLLVSARFVELSTLSSFLFNQVGRYLLTLALESAGFCHRLATFWWCRKQIMWLRWDLPGGTSLVTCLAAFCILFSCWFKVKLLTLSSHQSLSTLSCGTSTVAWPLMVRKTGSEQFASLKIVIYYLID